MILRDQKIVAQSYAQSDRDFYGRTNLEYTIRLEGKSYKGRFYTYLCLFLTGSRESITFKSEDGDETKVVLDNYPDYDLHRNIFTGIDFSRDILTIKDNLQMVKLLLNNKLLDCVKWTKEKRNELLKEQLMEMVFESGNYATGLLFDLIKVSEDALIKSRKVDVMETISIFMATLLDERGIIGYDDLQDTIKQSLEDLIGDMEKKCGDVYFWMEVDGRYKPIPISINEEYLSKFRTPKIREFKYDALYRWGITQTREFDPYMKKKIDDLYDKCPKDIKYFEDDTEGKRLRKEKFIKWLIEENQFYLYGKYLKRIGELLQQEEPEN